jgi:carbamoylphosphate synthase small subunit
MEAATPVARGLIVKQDVTEPANYRATLNLQDWLKRHGVTGLCGLDTRALTARIRWTVEAWMARLELERALGVRLDADGLLDLPLRAALSSTSR